MKNLELRCFGYLSKKYHFAYAGRNWYASTLRSDRNSASWTFLTDGRIEWKLLLVCLPCSRGNRVWQVSARSQHHSPKEIVHCKGRCSVKHWRKWSPVMTQCTYFNKWSMISNWYEQIVCLLFCICCTVQFTIPVQPGVLLSMYLVYCIYSSLCITRCTALFRGTCTVKHDVLLNMSAM